MVRLLVHKLWSCVGLQAPDWLGAPLAPYMTASPTCRTFIHHYGRTVSHHASVELERKAVAAASGPMGTKAFKLLMRFKLFVLTGALLHLIMRLLEDTLSFIMSTPRTTRICLWTIRAGWSYKKLGSKHKDHTSDEYAEQLGHLHSRWAKALAKVCRANGGIYVKFGQFAVSFGAIPREYRVELAQLEDKARPWPFREVQRRLLKELRCSATRPLVGEPGSGAVFVEFAEEATAAASLAQVHRARLASGEEVAVKLQYPRLKRAVRVDLSIMRNLCRLAKTAFPDFSLAWLYDEMEAKLKIELDFTNEIRNAQQLRDTLQGRSRLHACVPFIHEQHSTPHMIVMEWIQGIKLTDVDELRAHGINPHAVGHAFVKLFAELIFLCGYVHGDPHPGNVMIRPRGYKSWVNRVLHGTPRCFEIVLLDHGTYLSITPQLRHQFCQLWCSFITGDETVQCEMSAACAGKRFEKLLPAMLTASATNRQEELALQKKYGVKSFGDMTYMLSLIPRDFMELLRINTVIRSNSSLLGVKMAERKRMFAWYARRGMPHSSNRDAHVHPSSRNALYRARLLLNLTAWSVWCWTQALVQLPVRLVMRLFGQTL